MIANKELFKAIDRENLLLIRTEIQNGAEPNEKNGYGDTAMHFSITKGNLEILKLLLELGGDINAKNQEGVSLLLQSIGEEKFELSHFLIISRAWLTLFIVCFLVGENISLYFEDPN